MPVYRDNDFQLYDNLDFSKRVEFQCSGITTGTTRLLTVPNEAGTISLTSDIDAARTWATLQTFKDTTFKVVDDADASKTAVISLGGATANADLTLAWAGTVDRQLTLPDATGTLATLENAHTVTGAWLFAPSSGYITLTVDNTSAGSGYGLRVADASGFIGEFLCPTAGLTADRGWQLPDAGTPASPVQLVGNTDTVVLTNKTLGISSKIRCGSAGTDVFFVRQGSTTVGFRFETTDLTAARVHRVQNLTGTNVLAGDDAPAVAAGALGKVDLSAQTSAIGSTNLSSTPPAGVYAVEVYVACTTASGAGAPTLDVTVGWTDNVGATTQNVAAEPGATAFPLPLSATGRSKGRVLCRVASGDISYSTTINAAAGTPQYAIYIRVLSLG